MVLKVLTAAAVISLAVNISHNLFTSIPNNSSSIAEENVCQYVSNKSSKRSVNDESWTIMMYMLDGNGLSVGDQIDEMISVGNIPNNINIIIETNCDYYNISSNPVLFRYILTNNGLAIDDTITRVNMGQESTFQSFLEWGLDNFIADKTGIIIYNHGVGIKDVCSDDYGLAIGSTDSLLASETSNAYAAVFSSRNIEKLEFVGYDACAMQVQDVAENNSHYFNYMIASEEEEYASGWSYEYWLDDLYNHEDTITVLEEIADSFITNGSHIGDSWEQTMSVLDLSEMACYKNAFENLAAAINTTVSQNRLAFEGMVQSCTDYGGHASNTCPEQYELVDCYDLMEHMQESGTFDSYSSYIDTVMNALDDLVIYQVTTGMSGCGSRSHGLTLHYSLDHYSNSYPLEETNFVNWWSLFHVEHSHNHLDGYNSQYHSLRCDCGNVVNIVHDYTRAFYVTEQLHVKLCDCGYYYLENHNMIYFNGHGQTMLYCEDCDYIINLNS